VTRADLRQKTRFDVANAAALDLTELRPQDKIGLITFSGSSIIHFMPTLDHATAKTILANLNPHSMRHTGSDFTAPIKDLIHASTMQPGQYAAVLLSDGEPIPEEVDKNLDGLLNALEAAEIPIFTVGLGTDWGSQVDLFDPQDLLNQVANPRTAKSITTKRNKGFLKNISTLTDGEYYELEDGEWIEEISEDLDDISPSYQAVQTVGTNIGTIDYSPYAMTLFLILFFVEIVYLFPKQRLLSLALVFFLFTGCQNNLLKAHQENEKGIAKYEVSLYEKARTHFEASALYRTKEEIPFLNLGNNYIQKKEYKTAHSYFEKSMRAKPEDYHPYFNDGVAMFMWAEQEFDPTGCFMKNAVERYDQAIMRFEEAKTKGINTDKNITYVKKRIKDAYELHYTAKNCPPSSSSSSSYQSKHAPPPPQEQNQDQQNNKQNQNQQDQNQKQKQQQDQQQQQNQQQKQEQKNQDPQQQQQQKQQDQQQQSSQDQDVNENEKQEIKQNIERIKQNTSGAKDFKQTKNQQRPTDKSEVDDDLYW
jgi:Ca-activated chloride channel family protein